MRLSTFAQPALFLLFTCSALPQNTLKFLTVNREVVEGRLKSFSKDDTQRELILKKMFGDAGCDAQISELRVPRVKQPDLICILPGESNQQIIVGAHFDHVSAGDGVVDNWSGASLLPSLYEALHSERRHHTFVFVAFSGEEQGELGSAGYVKNMAADDVERTIAMVNMDTLGVGPTAVWASHSEPKLVSALAVIAHALKLPISAVNVDKVGSSDSEQFAKRKIPRITIHSITQETWPILHSARDKLSAIKLDDYYDTYRLIGAYLAYLDQQLGAEKSGSK